MCFSRRGFSSFLKQGNYAAHCLVYVERSADIFVVDVQRDHEKTGIPAILDFQIDFGIDSESSLKILLLGGNKAKPPVWWKTRNIPRGKKMTWTYRIYPLVCVFRWGRSRRKLSLIGWTNSIYGVLKVDCVWFVLFYWLIFFPVFWRQTVRRFSYHMSKEENACPTE